ncbi:hypothetical protein TRM7557_01960 [Tritonibacter multivorans]|uniref:Uncharacterized protein n=1 Tax=Tritonibacter multivorans TaxID=928856 RepID=A0A0P1GB54_9RHOB|nr:hypothetical protein TRM7557_01960 [Tritonibacter multivorans]
MGHGRVAVVIQHITEHHRRALKPGHRAQGGQIRFHHIVAITRLPAAGGIAIRRRHLQIRGQQVSAAMGLPLRGIQKTLCKAFGLKPLPHQTTLHINKTHQYGVNQTRSNLAFQNLGRERCGHIVPLVVGDRQRPPPKGRPVFFGLTTPGCAVRQRTPLSRSGRGGLLWPCRRCIS